MGVLVSGVWCVVCGVVCGVWCGVWCVVWCVVCGVVIQFSEIFVPRAVNFSQL
jgi:hypothetical protein